MHVIVNVGGLGSRMGPWAPHPKPFLPIGPFDGRVGYGPSVAWRWCYWLTQSLRYDRSQHARITLAVGRGDPVVLQHAAELSRQVSRLEGCHSVAIVLDGDGDLGTLAGYRAARKSKNEDTIVVNGDDLVDGESVQKFVALARKHAVLTTARVVQCNEFGVLTVQDGYVTEYEEKPHNGRFTVGCGGLYIPEADWSLACLSANVAQYIRKLREDKKTVQACPVTSWATITDPARYVAACHDKQWQDAAFDTWKAAQHVS